MIKAKSEFPEPKDSKPVLVRSTGAVPTRLIFEASEEFVSKLDAEWHRRKLKSRSETIRVLLGEALK